MTSHVALFVPCLVEQFHPEIIIHCKALLESVGLSVFIPPKQTCCGQPAFNCGYHKEARHVAMHFLSVFGDWDGPIVCPSGSCVSMVNNHYPRLLSESAAAQLEKVRNNLFEFMHFLYIQGGLTIPWPPFPHRVFLHHGCHTLRELHLENEPRELLKAIPHCELCEESEINRSCCGFGGIFSFYHHALAEQMANQRLQYIAHTGADLIVCMDTGCMLHLETGNAPNESSIPMMHTASFLWHVLKYDNQSLNDHISRHGIHTT